LNKLSTSIAPQVPANIEDLQKFALIGREKLVSVRAEIRAIEKLGLASDVRDQKKEEAQLLAGALLEAEARIGEITKAIPKQPRIVNVRSNTAVTSAKPKEEVIKEMGFTKIQVSRFETLADNRDIIEQVKQEAEANDELPTRSEVLRRVAGKTTAQLLVSSDSNEWYTPIKYIAAAWDVMGGIDLDPGSCEQANEIVKARVFFTKEDDGLKHDWPGRVWMNPPYGGLTEAFVSRLINQYNKGITKEAIVLVNSHATDTKWFQPLWDHLLCFTNHRINFIAPGGLSGIGSTHGSVFIYIGPKKERFANVFSQFGAVVGRFAQ
jgi:phage N-6-adenine-methyltransferase